MGQRRKTILATLALWLGLGGGAAAFDLPALTAADIRAQNPPAAGIPAAPPLAEWTVMVFINAKNNLEEFGLKDLNEMESAGSSDKVKVVAQLGRIKGYYSGDGDWTGVRRYLVTKDADMTRVASPVLADLGHADMGDYREVIDFVRWAKSAYPAQKYLLVVWNHGSGWTKAAAGARGISYDDESGGHITIPQLGAVLAETGGVDIYASDACLMQMAEVAWELKDHAAYIVGSEETEPADGYPYDAVLSALNANPALTPSALARELVTAYGAYYAERGKGATLSALQPASLTGFLALADEFTAAARAAGDRGVVKRGLYYAQHYAYDDNKDLGSFLDYVAAKSADARLRGAAVGLSSYLKTLIPYKAAANYRQTPEGLAPTDYTQASGLAVYLPGTKPPPSYSELKWARDSSWDEFLSWIAPPK